MWVGWSAVVVAVSHLVASVSLARDGAFSPSGFFAVGAGFTYLAWMAAVSIVLLRRQGVPVHEPRRDAVGA